MINDSIALSRNIKFQKKIFKQYWTKKKYKWIYMMKMNSK